MSLLDRGLTKEDVGYLQAFSSKVLMENCMSHLRSATLQSYEIFAREFANLRSLNTLEEENKRLVAHVKDLEVQVADRAALKQTVKEVLDELDLTKGKLKESAKELSDAGERSKKLEAKAAEQDKEMSSLREAAQKAADELKEAKAALLKAEGEAAAARSSEQNMRTALQETEGRLVQQLKQSGNEFVMDGYGQALVERGIPFPSDPGNVRFPFPEFPVPELPLYLLAEPETPSTAQEQPTPEDQTPAA